ncbi:MAG: hypothetical protein ACLR23_01265 [Clostridia bacterium]
MVSGQMANMEAENSEISPEQLAFIEIHKTGKLIQAALVSGRTVGRRLGRGTVRPGKSR